jgi:hypothetical protein
MNDFAVHIERADGARLTLFTGATYGGSKYGLGIRAGGFTGWSRRKMRGNVTSRPFQHGDILGKRYRDGQKITLEAIASTATQFEMDALDEEVTGFLTEGEECRLIVDKPGEQRWVDAVLDEVDFDQLHYQPRANVLMSFIAPDAVRYGKEHRNVPVPVGATVELENWGSLPAWPSMVVTAASSTPNGYAMRLLSATDETLGYWRIGAALTSPHTLDFKRAQVRWGGVVRWGAVHSGTPFQIPRSGVSKLRLEYPGVGSASATITYADSY